MLYFIISMLIMLYLLDRATRVGRREFALLDTRFRLFELRDALRLAAIREEVPQNQWFEYLDTTMTKFIDLLPRFTVWGAIILFLVHRNDPPVTSAREKLEVVLAAEENICLAKFYGNLTHILVDFLFRRHITISYVLMGVAFSVEAVMKVRDRLVRTLTVSPETSTLMEYLEASQFGINLVIVFRAYTPSASSNTMPESQAQLVAR